MLGLKLNHVSDRSHWNSFVGVNRWPPGTDYAWSMFKSKQRLKWRESTLGSHFDTQVHDQMADILRMHLKKYASVHNPIAWCLAWCVALLIEAVIRMTFAVYSIIRNHPCINNITNLFVEYSKMLVMALLPTLLVYKSRLPGSYINCRQMSNIRSNTSQNLNVPRLAFQLPLPNPLKPGVQSKMKM